MARIASDDYFAKYGPMQRFKHWLLQRYLQAWYPILGSSRGKVLYVETHAGRGEHDTGDLGSPLIAAQTLINHNKRDRILRQCKVVFTLMELNPEFFQNLKTCIGRINPPQGIKFDPVEGDFAQVMKKRLDSLEESGGHMAPAFVFVDPYGYSIPIELLHRVLSHPSCEVLVTFMADYAAMAMGDASKAGLLTTLFGTDEWQSYAALPGGQRTDAAIGLYERCMRAKWCTALRMSGQRDYALMHFTNEDRGREEIKRAVWAVSKKAGREGSFHLFRADDPQQFTLLDEGRNIDPLIAQFKRDFLNRTIFYPEMRQWLLATDYLDVHLHEALRRGRDVENWLKTTHRGRIGPAMTASVTVEETLL